MIGKAMQDAMNEQINKELFSSYLYLSMAAYFEDKNVAGFAHWMRVQADELQKYLGGKGLWNEGLEGQWKAEAEKTLNQAIQEAEGVPLPDPKEMLLYTFADLPPQLREQMEDYLNFLKEKEG